MAGNTYIIAVSAVFVAGAFGSTDGSLEVVAHSVDIQTH